MTAQTNAQRMKAMRARKKLEYTRLDVLLKNADAKLIADGSKRNSVTKAEYITSLLHKPNRGRTETQIDVFTQTELEAEIVALKALLTDKEARKEVIRLEDETKELKRLAALDVGTIDRKIAEIDGLRQDRAVIIKLNKALKKEIAGLKKSNTVTRGK